MHTADLRQELLAAIRAGRELSPEHDEQVADAAMKRYQATTEAYAEPSAAASLRPLDRVELGGSVLAAVIGVSGMAYAYHQLQIAASMLLGDPGPIGQDALDAALPFFAVVTVALVLHVVGAVLDVRKRDPRGYRLLIAATGILLIAGFVALTYTGGPMVSIVMELYLQSGLVTMFTVVTVLLAILSCGAAFWRRQS